MKNPVTQIFGPLYGPRINALAVVGVLLLLGMLAIFLLDYNVSLFHFFNRLSEITGRGFWANITSLGEGLLLLALASLVAIRWPAAAWAILIGGIVGTLIVHGLKEAVLAPRPAMMLPEGSFNIIGPKLQVVAFPSGHTSSITAFATILFLHSRNNLGVLALVVLVFLVGISRMVVGAHWPVDVFGGWLVGMIVGVISFSLAQRWTLGLKKPAQFSIIAFSLACAGALFWLEPYMAEATLLRWTVAGIGLIAGGWALVVTWRRNELH